MKHIHKNLRIHQKKYLLFFYSKKYLYYISNLNLNQNNQEIHIKFLLHFFLCLLFLYHFFTLNLFFIELILTLLFLFISNFSKDFCTMFNLSLINFFLKTEINFVKLKFC